MEILIIIRWYPLIISVIIVFPLYENPICCSNVLHAPKLEKSTNIKFVLALAPLPFNIEHQYCACALFLQSSTNMFSFMEFLLDPPIYRVHFKKKT